MCLAVPGRIVEVQSEGEFLRTGKVDFGGVLRAVDLSCVPEARVGDFVIVHVGMALSVLDEDEAREVIETLREMASLEAADGGGES